MEKLTIKEQCDDILIQFFTLNKNESVVVNPVLESFLPDGINLSYIQQYLNKYNIAIRIDEPRSSYYGQCHVNESIREGSWCWIYISDDLSSEGALIVLLHELAHHIAREIAPVLPRIHGKLWQYIYSELIFRHYRLGIRIEVLRRLHELFDHYTIDGEADLIDYVLKSQYYVQGNITETI